MQAERIWEGHPSIRRRGIPGDQRPCEWFNRSHRQHLDQQAVLAYIEMLTRVQQLVEQDMTRVALTAEEVMSSDVDTVPLTVPKVLEQ